MARPHYSIPPAAPRRPSSITVRHSGGSTVVEVDGVQLRYLTGMDVSFGSFGQFPEVRVRLAPPDCDMQIEGGMLVVDGVEMPEAVLRSLYLHLRDRISMCKRWAPPAPDSFTDAARS